ncbi:hypothetical protein Patl1_31387 [Pistacia atlantica]|uniref:Uncharacterized protein n=1 Tax=Pistacia atlantica TaxID=434234 RepID=A0ACC1ANS7_9ROSI|nr:hypothetical protein Patl1_31387 [Pistacia atlantica]
MEKFVILVALIACSHAILWVEGRQLKYKEKEETAKRGSRGISSQQNAAGLKEDLKSTKPSVDIPTAEKTLSMTGEKDIFPPMSFGASATVYQDGFPPTTPGNIPDVVGHKHAKEEDVESKFRADNGGHSDPEYNSRPTTPGHGPGVNKINPSESTLCRHLARRLVQVGVTDVFSVPGDFDLILLDHLIAEPRLNLIGCCNELNAGYATDVYAWLRGVGVCVVTFTVGGLHVPNAIAGAYSENLPLVCTVGGPSSDDDGTNRILHHTIGLPDFTKNHILPDGYLLSETRVKTAKRTMKGVGDVSERRGVDQLL